MQLKIIDAGTFKLDGGALFGVVPKSLWSRYIDYDENNLCDVAMRCLLIEDNDRLILIDTGIGEKQDEKFLKNYYLHGPTLQESLQKNGFALEDVTDVFFTHLHFDHCGGATRWLNSEKQAVKLMFPHAQYWSNQAHWHWATHPNAREKASFLRENIEPIEKSGQLNFIDPESPSPFSQFDILFVNGHTDRQMIPLIKYKEHTIVFMADLIPMVAHIPMAWVPSFDTRPLLTLDEKSGFLKDAVLNDFILFFEHDARYECCKVVDTDKGVRMETTFPLTEIL